MPIEICKIKDTGITWIDVLDPQMSELEDISKEYNLNSYTLLDSLDPDHLPKFEEHNDIYFVILRVLQDEHTKEQSVQSLSTKIAIFYNDRFIITIHRMAQPFVHGIKENYVDSGKITSTVGIAVKIVRDALHSYEAPAIKLSDEIDHFETTLFLKNAIPSNMIEAIYYQKNKASLYKKLILLTHDVVSSIRVEGEDKPALQDVRDLHTRLLLLYDQIQDDANNLLNIYLSLSARKTSDVMKVLTVFSVFFMPLTFIVGVYGMNFEYMPELKSKWGYPLTILGMVIVSVIIYIWFKRKKWL